MSRARRPEKSRTTCARIASELYSLGEARMRTIVLCERSYWEPWWGTTSHGAVRTKSLRVCVTVDLRKDQILTTFLIAPPSLANTPR
eukprot:2884007-Pyramimonas_sp.AAC.1